MHIHAHSINPNPMAPIAPQQTLQAIASRRAEATRKHLAAYAASLFHDETAVAGSQDAPHRGQSGPRRDHPNQPSFHSTFSIHV